MDEEQEQGQEQQSPPWKNNWTTGDIITANKLNNVEQALVNIAANTMIDFGSETENPGQEHGLVPAFNVNSGDQDKKFLCADGQWKKPSYTDSHIDIGTSTSKAYLIGTLNSSGNVTGVIKTGVYMINGRIVGATFSGNGSLISELNAGNITTGTVSAARLPSANGTNAGIVRTVEGSGITINNGEISVTKPLPTVGNNDNGKFLRVSNGAWAVVEVQSAAGQSF